MNASTALILVVFLALGLVALKGTMKRMLHGCCGGGGPKARRVKVADKNPSHYPYLVTLTIEGMSCSACALRVENTLNSMDGVWAKVNLPKKTASVRAKGRLQEADIRRAVSRAGYFVTSYKEETATTG